MSLKTDHQKLVSWYESHRRDLPWRISKDAYRIWISEVMLQQTTVAAVVPYYEKFMSVFPTVHALASSPLEKVLENWSGLGYYSRARNLHKAAQILSKHGFPQTHTNLIEIPGMGPYTSRAVSSLAFDEKVGVLDGNVIRILSRKYGLKIEWWKTPGRNELQNISDSLAAFGKSAELNQAMMELGATICTPQKISCGICPWNKDCVSLKEGTTDTLPLKKPRKKSEVWIWKVNFQKRKNKIGLIKNEYAPFLKGQLIFPGSVEKAKSKPKIFAAKHGITHHDIYIQKSLAPIPKNIEWHDIKDLKKINPASVMSKVINAMGSLCLAILLASPILVSCTSKAKKTDLSQLNIKQIPKPEPVLQKIDNVENYGLTSLNLPGQSEKLTLSPDGHKFAFISTERPYAKGTEIYEMDLVLNKERRVTFQDGQITSVKYLNPQQIFYTSNTDEIKESLWNENSLTTQNQSMPAQDIYLSDVFGNTIVRLTNNPGFEGDLIYISDPQNPRLIFTANENKMLLLNELNLLNNEIKNFKHDPQVQIYSPTLSPNRKFVAWIQFNENKKTSTIEVYNIKKSTSKKLIEMPGKIYDLKWIQYSDTEIKEAFIYSIENETGISQLEFVSLTEPCRKNLLDLSAVRSSVRYPEFKTGPKPELYLTVIKENNKSLYKKDFSEPSGSCIIQVMADKIKE